MAPSPTQTVYDFLLRGFHATPASQPEARWEWLVAAHVATQQVFSLHWRIHWQMLRFAVQTRDYAEAAGQALRLALVPVGHLIGRLPIGNTGRADVSAFTPMTVSERSRALIRAASADR